MGAADANGNYVKTGQITFGLSVDWSEGPWNIAKGAIWVGKGRITEMQGLILHAPIITYASTPEQDIAMLQNIRAQMRAGDAVYSALLFNCIHWAFLQHIEAEEIVNFNRAQLQQ